jgi:hypothetical protein
MTKSILNGDFCTYVQISAFGLTHIFGYFYLFLIDFIKPKPTEDNNSIFFKIQNEKYFSKFKLKIADDVINDKSMEEGQNEARKKWNKKRLIRLRKAISIFAKPSQRRSKRCSVCIFACCCFAEMNKFVEKCFPNN